MVCIAEHEKIIDIHKYKHRLIYNIRRLNKHIDSMFQNPGTIV